MNIEKIDLSDKIMRCFKCDRYNYVSRLSRGLGFNINTGKSIEKYEIVCVDCDGKSDGHSPDNANLGSTIMKAFAQDDAIKINNDSVIDLRNPPRCPKCKEEMHQSLVFGGRPSVEAKAQCFNCAP